jgi:hypothetical protein
MTSIAENNREKDLSQDEKTQTKTLRNKTSFAENNNQEKTYVETRSGIRMKRHK